jgi:hypothetical protein
MAGVPFEELAYSGTSVGGPQAACKKRVENQPSSTKATSRAKIEIGIKIRKMIKRKIKIEIKRASGFLI